MRYIVFGPERREYPVALLTRYLRERELQQYLGHLALDTVAYAITTPAKAKNTDLMVYLKELLPVLCGLQTDYLLVTEVVRVNYLGRSASIILAGEAKRV